MDNKVERFFSEMKGKRVAFCGVGVTNTPLVKKFLQKGAIVTVCDRSTRDKLGEVVDEMESSGAVLSLGDDYLKNLNVDIIFRAPGIKFHLPEFEEYRKKGVIVTSEMEVFFELCPCKIFAVTGSDGKTTTTTLISEMLKAQGYTVHLGGNIGRALLPIIEDINADDFAVVELSSFQLISMRQSPDVAVVTNVAPNHLDIHKDMAEYVDSKKNIFLHQNAFSRTVLNLDNEITDSFSGNIRGRLSKFSRRSKVENGAYCDEKGDIYYARNGEKEFIMSREGIRLCGDHNVENYLAAIAATEGFVDVGNIVKVAREFGGVEHRIEFVRELDGVKYYNDSIATNPTRTIAGLNAFPQKIIIIAGGYDKHIPFEPLAPKIIEKVKVLVLMGVTADKIEKVVRECPDFDENELEIIHAKDMEEAVRLAREAAVDGDVISLSPACASFDIYKNFEVRGNHYKEIVNSL